MSTTITADIDVDVPVRAAYDQWTQFESFPEFLSGVDDVTQIDDAQTHWVVSLGGVRREFAAQIIDQVPTGTSCGGAWERWLIRAGSHSVPSPGTAPTMPWSPIPTRRWRGPRPAGPTAGRALDADVNPLSAAPRGATVSTRMKSTDRR